jgi:hypothetical protein
MLVAGAARMDALPLASSRGENCFFLGLAP